MGNLIVFIPITVLIAGALITRKIAPSMIAAAFLAAVIIYRGNFFSGFIEMIYKTLSNPSYQFVLIILAGFGGLIKLFQESGALLGFGNLLSRYAHGPKKPLIIAWLMAFVMFGDDYLASLAVSFSMKEITDRNRIPREHLAYQANVMASCVCVLIPLSSWTAFTVGLISDHGLTYMDYISAIPYMFYPLIASALCLLIAAGIVPKAGPLKKAYERVKEGGPAFYEEEREKSIVNLEMPENQKATSALNAVIPIIVLVIVVLMFDNDLVHGLLAAIAVQGVLYIPQKIMTISEFVDHFFEGAKSMAAMAVLICFGFMLSSANEEIGLFDVLIGGLGHTVPPALLPVLVFVIVAFITFATAGYWLMQVIAIPIFIPLALAMNVNPALVIAAVMSGVTLGCNCCFYADPVFMTAAGTGISNLRLVKTTAPYAIGAAVLSAAGYLVTGLMVT